MQENHNNEKKNHIAKTEPELTQLLELAEKGIKIV